MSSSPIDIEFGMPYMFCPLGFEAGSDISVFVTGPDSIAIEYVLKAIGESQRWHVPFPGEPMGDYRVSAIQSDLVALGEFTVVATTKPRVAVRPWSGSAGETFTVAVIGFEPSATATVFLYRSDPGGWRFVTMFETQTDEEGDAIILVATETDSEPEQYGISFVDEEGIQTRGFMSLSSTHRFSVLDDRPSIIPPLPPLPPVPPVQPVDPN